ncbi:SGNH/GDSL hydrolase family protein [Emticicia sp. BO119]|uniref:SGNH/GDSL hydrolase family protein n=1 Tax=Emticicia sp. BO119 TaxID=2757768 RepID=UPI0015F109F2|nr:SGNH/GDSL hydrolase family protein [Emticicia sp. BO119]MBA4851644.1 SGNH/GDSL hydrolase family protein [Emticicia sp. BO119]
MKNTFKSLTLILLSLLMFSLTQDKPTKVILFGDSITQAGVGPTGYITKMKETLEKQGIKDKYQLIGAGIGGNKVYDLFLRMEDDVLNQNPDVVVIYIGVNDVWHKSSYGTGTDADKFTEFYTAIIKKLQSKGIKVICCTPAAIGERNDNSNPQDGDMNHYSNLIRNLASKYDCPLVDLRKEFIAYNLKNNPQNRESGILTTDRVHLNETGNQMVADLILKAIVK